MLELSLLPVFGSPAMRLHDGLGSWGAEVTVENATVQQPNAGPDVKPADGCPIVAKGYSEQCDARTNSSGLCAHIVVVNKFRYGSVSFKLRVRLPGWPVHSHSSSGIITSTEARVPPGNKWENIPTTATRLFMNGGYDLPISCMPGTNCREGLLLDTVGAAETVVYEVGCNGPPPWNEKVVDHELLPRNSTAADQVGPSPYKSCANRRVQCSNSMWGC